jgi:acetyl esterase/lipase
VPNVNVNRRSLLTTVVVAAATATSRAQTATETIELWPAGPPGGPGPQGPEQRSPRGAITGVSSPRLIAYRPTQPNRTAVLVIAGGGYVRIGAGTEGTPTCQWLQSAGITAFELIYRLPGDGWPRLAPFQDGQRAMRIVRSRAAAYGIDAARIGVIGFSAGGHLAGMTAVRPTAPLYPPVDAADTVSARPDFAGLIYPVLTMMPPFDHTHSRREIVGPHPSEAESEDWSVERHVGAGTPPTFLAQAADDPVSPVDNSLMMFGALRAAQIPAELHIFQSGGHGWGLGRPDTEVHAWPGLFTDWAQRNTFLPP